MQEVSPEELLQSPIGKWAATSTALVWCHSSTLGGVVTWGRPTLEETKDVFRLIDLYRHPAVSPRFTFVTDGRGLEGVDFVALEFMIDWIRDRLDELRVRVDAQVGIIPDGVVGLLLAGVMPASAGAFPLRVFTDPAEAFQLLAPDSPNLRDELQAAAERIRGVAPEVRRVRELLRTRAGNLSVKEAARRLGASTRSLQRALSKAGISFRDEQLRARFESACDLLENSDVKVSAVAARLGISERALSQLFNANGAPSPTEFRRRNRSATT